MADFTPLVCVVDFHHARGPEIEHWIGAEGSDPTAENDWQLIPYMALPDGAHASEEEFSYFSLVHKAHAGQDVEPTTVFGISCCHAIDASTLLWKSEDVTRSAVQKAVVAITNRPQSFSALREKLSVVTKAWFAQKDFRELEILQRFQEDLAKGRTGHEDERDQYFGLSLRELVHQFKWQILVLFKCLMLQPKCEQVCQVQFSLISLIPGLVRSLQDCADPQMDRDAETRRKPDSVRTSDRASLLAYMGVPLQIFGKGSVFGPYTPLQQLDILTDLDTKSYIVGSTNSLLIQQKDRYCDVLIDLDDNSVQILTPTLKPALVLSTADRRWIDFITQQVNDTWDETDPSRPKHHGYAGSEEFIRMQFEEYLLACLSAERYHHYLAATSSNKPILDSDPSVEFSATFLEHWRQTENYKLWLRTTDSHIFDIVEPRHPMAGGLTVEDVQRRLAAQVAELHLDERFSQTREVVGKRLADGRTQVTGAFNRVWADIEVMREAQRKKAAVGGGSGGVGGGAEQKEEERLGAGQRASAYLSSWGTWASEKRKGGWGRTTSTTVPAAVPERGKISMVDESVGEGGDDGSDAKQDVGGGNKEES